MALVVERFHSINQHVLVALLMEFVLLLGQLVELGQMPSLLQQQLVLDLLIVLVLDFVLVLLIDKLVTDRHLLVDRLPDIMNSLPKHILPNQPLRHSSNTLHKPATTRINHNTVATALQQLQRTTHSRQLTHMLPPIIINHRTH